jgi:antitoxin component YwqK of YwqJK toxin-antitoxin module
MRNFIAKFKYSNTMKTPIKILCIILLIPAFAFSQTESKPKYAPGKEKHKNKVDELNRKQGVWKYYNELGDIIQEIEYVDDVRHGISKKFFPYGKIMEEIEYQNGIKEGSYHRYYYSGQSRMEGEYSNGRKENRWTAYYSDGQVKTEGNYKAGNKDGEWKFY